MKRDCDLWTRSEAYPDHVNFGSLWETSGC